MYEMLHPAFDLKTTISHPLNPEWVIGFEARNTNMGWRTVLMKDEAVDEDGRVMVPVPVESELAVIQGDEVHTMDGETFEEEHSMHTFHSGDSKATINYVPIENDQFEVLDKEYIPIST